MQMSKPGIEFSVHVSYIEIYKEELRDLIDNTMTAREILIREDEEGHTGRWENWGWEWHAPYLEASSYNRPCRTISIFVASQDTKVCGNIYTEIACR